MDAGHGWWFASEVSAGAKLPDCCCAALCWSGSPPPVPDMGSREPPAPIAAPQRCWYTAVSQEHRRVRSRARRAARALAEVAAMKLVESCSSPCTLSPPMLLSPPPAPRMGESMILGVLWGGIRLVGIDVACRFRVVLLVAARILWRVQLNRIQYIFNQIQYQY